MALIIMTWLDIKSLPSHKSSGIPNNAAANPKEAWIMEDKVRTQIEPHV
jgi:hypothetical protein